MSTNLLARTLFHAADQAMFGRQPRIIPANDDLEPAPKTSDTFSVYVDNGKSPFTGFVPLLEGNGHQGFTYIYKNGRRPPQNVEAIASCIAGQQMDIKRDSRQNPWPLPNEGLMAQQGQKKNIVAASESSGAPQTSGQINRNANLLTPGQK